MEELRSLIQTGDFPPQMEDLLTAAVVARQLRTNREEREARQAAAAAAGSLEALESACWRRLLTRHLPLAWGDSQASVRAPAVKTAGC